MRRVDLEAGEPFELSHRRPRKPHCKSSTITLALLTTLREDVRELALCAREIIGEKLASTLGPEADVELPEAPLAGAPCTLPSGSPAPPRLVTERFRRATHSGNADGLAIPSTATRVRISLFRRSLDWALYH